LKTYGVFKCIFAYAPVPHGEGLPFAKISVVSLSEEESVSLNAGDNEDFSPSKC